MTKRITGSDIRHFRVISPTKIEIELCAAIDPSHFDLHFDVQITGASATMAATVGGEPQRILNVTTAPTTKDR